MTSVSSEAAEAGPRRLGHPTTMLPPVAGIAADLGFLASLAVVLVGLGPIGLWCGLGLGALSLAAIVTSTVLRLERTSGHPADGAYALVGVRVWNDDERSAA